MSHQTGQEMATELAEFFSGASAKDRKDFVEEMVFGVHRTIQQRVMSGLVGLILKYAELDPGQFDARNESTVRLCKEIKLRVDFRWLHLPYI